MSRYNQWIAAGSTTANQQKWLDNPKDDLINGIAEENTLVAAPALYGPDWQKLPVMVKETRMVEKENEDHLRMWFMTNGNPNGGDPVAFSENLSVDTVELLSGDAGSGRTVRIDGHIWNNSDKNSMGATFPSVKANNGKAYSTTLVTKVTDGTEYVVDYPGFSQ